LQNTARKANGDQMLTISGVSISLDKREKCASIDFVSHAHSDHIGAAKASNAVLASKETIQLVNASLGIKIKHLENSKVLDTVMLPAGHIMGSRQLYALDKDTGLSFLYSGDFQMQKSIVAEPIITKEADVLIIDSTYPYPEVNFGSKYDTIGGLQDWVLRSLRNSSIVFSAYATGKAQEVIAILNEIGIKPVVTKKISMISKIYNENGYSLQYASAYDSNDYEDLLTGDFVGITERRDVDMLSAMLEHVHKRSFRSAVVTGFARMFKFYTDVQFSLSDHADFAQSIEYINEVNPKVIYTYGSNAEVFATNLRKFGFNAMPYVPNMEMKVAVASSVIGNTDKQNKDI
jgi:putative mRNA 3-end processing factor